MNKLRLKILTTSLILTLACPIALMGGDNYIRPDVGLPLFLKIITYDESFASGIYDKITIYVLYDRSISESYQHYLEVEEYFRIHSDINVDGVPVQMRGIQIKSLETIKTGISSEEYNLLLVTVINKQQIKTVTDFARSARMHSYSLNAEHVPLGITIGVKPDTHSGAIMVNLMSSRLEGSKYSARLLKMCEVIEE